jgi:NRAMP (natural resistance-associated macrophage protein)-like metal ion transporter
MIDKAISEPPGINELTAGVLDGPEASKPKWPKLLQILGPGLITGASDDDPSGIATYSQAGAQFGFGLGWVLLLCWPLMCAIQEISARIGRVTGRGIAGVIRLHYPAPVLYVLIFLLVAANTINLGADLGAMGAATTLLIGGPTPAYIAAFGAVSLLLQVFVRYSRYVSWLKWLTLSLFAYVAVAFVVHMPWATVGYHLVVPDISLKASYLTVVVAILGTTISPYLFFWQAEEEVEEVKERIDAKPLERAPGQSKLEFRRIRIDTYLGMFLSNVVAIFIVITTAATLHAHGVTDIQTSSQAALALRPIAGPFVFLVFALGIIGTGLLAVPVLAGSAAYAVGEARASILRDHRRRFRDRRRSQFHEDRPDQGAVLECSDQWRRGRAGDGHDDAAVQPQRSDGPVRPAGPVEGGWLARHSGHGRCCGRHVRDLGGVTARQARAKARGTSRLLKIPVAGLRSA